MIGHRLRTTLVGVALATLTGAWPADAQQIDYAGSVQYASGDYLFTERASALYLYNSLVVTAGRVRVSASVPLVLQNTSWVTYYSGDGSTTGAASSSGTGHGMTGEGNSGVVDTTSSEQLGFADPLVHGGVQLLRQGKARPSLSLTFDVKIPLADVESGFGTGEWDYAGGLALAKSVGTTFLFADISYWYLGDMPGAEFKNTLAFGAGVGRSLGGGRFGLLASLLGNTEVQEGAGAPVQASLGLSYLLDMRRSLMGSASLGLTESAPDISVSFGWLFRF